MSLLFEYLVRSATDHPDETALVIGGGELSYRGLLELSLQVAAGLYRQGIGHGSRVAIWLPKSVETYSGLLASLSLGAAYVPVDVAAPPGRVAWMLEDGRCDALVCRAADLRRLPRPWPETLRLAVVVGDVDEPAPDRRIVAWPELNLPGPSPPPPASEPEDLAYILYTSGSTGTPKGVAISHRAAAAFVEWAGGLCGLRPGDRVANQAALSFDLSVFDVFATLRSGATLLPVPDFLLGRGYPFARFIQDTGTTVWYSVPTLLARIAESQARKPVDLGSLRVVAFAGEPFSKAALVDFERHVSGARLFNFYGPTETNVCLYHEVTAADLEEEAPLPIGRPCPYSELRVRGVEDDAGELLVAGTSLMSGYWRSGQLERSVFVETDGRLFYPTGDHVSRISRDSRELFLFKGRRDSQIKLHGYRIELGEIEEVLAALPSVAEAAAVCRDERLLAFVVPRDGSGAPRDGELRDQLARRLPAYMIPRELRRLPELPRTDRGKVDRRRLLEAAQESS